MLKLARTLLLGLALAPALALSAAAQDIEYLGAERDWHAFQFQENGNPVCYMATKPTREEGNYRSRGDVFLLVTHRPGENSRDVVSIIAGYTYQPGGRVTATIGDQSFEMFTEQDGAWTRDAETDQQMVEAMKQGSNMVVRGTSSRNTATTDTYSLLGFTSAHNRISQACGL